MAKFNQVLNSRNVPECWSSFVQFLLYKKGDRNNILNYRGITLAKTILKFFTTILVRSIGICAERSGILPEGQAGFREERSCEDNIFVLQAKICLIISNVGGKLYTALVDFKRAFDSVNHELLRRKLYKMRMSGQTIKVIRTIYENARMKVKLNDGQYTKEIKITMGVLQSDSLSSVLFILFIYFFIFILFTTF